MGRWIQLRDADMREGYISGLCLSYVQDAFHTDHPFPSATNAFYANVGGKNHYDLPPLGITVPVYFSLGNVPAGHVAVRLDDGYVSSSTLGPLGSFHAVPYYHPNINDLISMYGKYNGGCGYLGWSEYVGSVKVVGWEDSRVDNFSEEIPFTVTTQDDPNLPLGETVVAQYGINGVHSWSDTVITLDGNETSRSRTSDSTVQPVNQVNSIGSFVAPEVPEEPVEVPTVPTEPGTPTKESQTFIEFLKDLLNKLVELLSKFKRDK